MAIYKIPKINSKDFSLISVPEDAEFVNPIDYRRNKYIEWEMAIALNIGTFNSNTFVELSDKWNLLRKDLKSNSFDTNLLSTLKAKSKGEQEKLLKNVSLTSASFQNFIFQAFEELNYKYSVYFASYYPSWVDAHKLPTLCTLREDGSIYIEGETTLSEGQLKQLLVQRTERISHFLDNGVNWHCFFTNYNSLAGRENFNNGQSHLHYISHFWGYSRKLVLKELKSRKHKFTTGVHIPYITQRSKKV